MSTLRAALARHGQEHLLRFWDELDADAQARLAAEVEAIDLDLVDGLVASLLEPGEAPALGSVEFALPLGLRPTPAADALAAAVLAGGDRLSRPA